MTEAHFGVQYNARLFDEKITGWGLLSLEDLTKLIAEVERMASNKGDRRQLNLMRRRAEVLKAQQEVGR